MLHKKSFHKQLPTALGTLISFKQHWVTIIIMITPWMYQVKYDVLLRNVLFNSLVFTWEVQLPTSHSQIKPFFWLPAWWASGFSGDHQQDHQCLWLLYCYPCMLTFIACNYVGNKIITITTTLFWPPCRAWHIRTFSLAQLPKFCIFNKDYTLFTIFRRKLCPSPLAWLTILLAPGYWTVRYDVRLACVKQLASRESLPDSIHVNPKAPEPYIQDSLPARKLTKWGFGTK